MACGILEHIARDIIKYVPELKDLTDKNGEEFKSVMREALNILDKEGVPNIVIEAPKDENTVSRVKVAICRICSDSGALRARFPEKMGKWFRINQGYKGRLRKEDWLCKGCYGEWYRDNRDWLNDQSVKQEDDAMVENVDVSEAEEEKKGPRKEYYMKTIVNLLFLVVKNLAPKAISHRKMLVRYITVNQLELNQLGTALHYLRKIGNGIIDQEDFEKECGIGKYADLFGYSSWQAKHTHTDILRLDEQERNRRKAEKQQKRDQEERERRQREQEEKREQERQNQLKVQLEKSEKESVENAKNEKLRKIAEARKKEDEEIADARKKQETLKQRVKDKREVDKRAKQLQREQSLKEIEQNAKTKEEELRRQKEERHRKQRAEMQSRALERKNQIRELELSLKPSS